MTGEWVDVVCVCACAGVHVRLRVGMCSDRRAWAGNVNTDKETWHIQAREAALNQEMAAMKAELAALRDASAGVGVGVGRTGVAADEYLGVDVEPSFNM